MGDTIRIFEQEEAFSSGLQKESGGTDTVFVHIGTAVDEEIVDASMEVRLREDNADTSFYVFFVLGILIILAALKSFFFQYLQFAFVSVYNINLARKNLINKNVLHSRMRLVLVFSFLFFFSFICTHYLLFAREDLLFFEVGYLKLMGYIIISLLAFLSGRYLFLQAIGHVFLLKDLIREYIYHTYSVLIVLSMGLIPVAILLPFVDSAIEPYLFYAVFIMLIIGAVMLLSRFIRMISDKKVSFFYLILYLCILEVAPVLVIYKVLSGLEIN